MRPYLLYGWALFGVVGEKSEHEVLELGAEVLSTNFSEVGVALGSQKQVVEVLFWARLFEGEYALHDNEEYNSERE